MKTAEEILKNTLGDIRYGLNGNEMNNQIIHAMEMYLLQSSLPSPSLPSDEEKKKSVINKILDDLPIREVRGEMSPDEWYGWFEEVYDKAFSICSTRIEEMEAKSKRMMQLENALKDSQILLKNFKSYATDSSTPVYFGGVSLDDALNTNWNLIKSITTTP